MTIKIGIVMDPISSITIQKDSSFAMLLEAQRRNWSVYYMEQKDLYCHDGKAYGRMAPLHVQDNPQHWFDLGEQEEQPLSELNVILMRKDPPFDMEYIYSTYILELAENEGVLIVNKPQTLRDANEKFYTAWFPQCSPPTLITRNADQLRGFLQQHKDIIIKPLNGKGGESIFRIRHGDPNRNVIIETLTEYETRHTMAQLFVPEISKGDKRILLIDGKPIDYALARIPTKGETRGNLSVGAKGVGLELNDRDRWICQQLAPQLRKKGLLFVGIDIIGDYLTEINITSPTCIREIDTLYDLNISAVLFDCIAEHIKM